MVEQKTEEKPKCTHQKFKLNSRTSVSCLDCTAVWEGPEGKLPGEALRLESKTDMPIYLAFGVS